MSGERRIPIPGTARQVWPGSRHADALGADAEADLTVWLRAGRGGGVDLEVARATGTVSPRERRYASREALAHATGADPADVDAVRRYCDRFGLEVAGVHWRSVTVAGPIDRLIRAFGATVAIFEDGLGRRFRHRSGTLHVLPELDGVVRGIFGLHQWPRSKRVRSLERHATPLMAGEVASRYQFPESAGSGQTIGIVQLRGGFNGEDFDRCMAAQGVSAQHPFVKPVDRTMVAHAAVTAKDVEAALDVQVVASLAPQARVVVYDAPDSERGFLDALREAVFGDEYAPNVVSVSYGWPENVWTPVALDIADELFAAAALLGISVACSSGDDGAALDIHGSPHVLAPASSPFAVACGATAILPAGEVAWQGSGGGFSARFPVPDWQATGADCAAHYGMPAGRGVPDVAAQQSPGYYVVVDGTELAMGGTSAVAPVWAALVARINQRLGVPLGFFTPILYRQAGMLFGAVTQGNNGRFDAGPGWNPCTGLGIPNGVAIEAALRS